MYIYNYNHHYSPFPHNYSTNVKDTIWPSKSSDSSVANSASNIPSKYSPLVIESKMFETYSDCCV